MGSSDKIIAQLRQDTRVLVKYSLIKEASTLRGTILAVTKNNYLPLVDFEVVVHGEVIIRSTYV